MNKIYTAPRKAFLAGCFHFNDKQIKLCMPSSPTDTARYACRSQREDTFAIDSGKNLIPAESIYNCYTGIGGCTTSNSPTLPATTSMPKRRRSSRWDSSSPRMKYAGTWWICCVLSHPKWFLTCVAVWAISSTICQPHNAYGFDIDGKAVSVARYLYPEAHIEKCDIRQYYPEQRFDVIIGNPPFNLKFDYKLSQEYYMDKAYDVLNPAGS